MATTDLKLDEPGTLPRPGPAGRFVRLAFGLLCLYYIVGLLQVTDNLIDNSGHIRAIIWNGIPFALFLVSYVVNIGFSRAWKKWPAVVSAAALVIIAGVGYGTTETVESNLLALSIWVWDFYIFSHLGSAFLIAALIGTPGCEMRAFHDLYSRLTGVMTKEHVCPVGPLHPIDQWEARLRNRQGED